MSEETKEVVETSAGEEETKEVAETSGGKEKTNDVVEASAEKEEKKEPKKTTKQKIIDEVIEYIRMIAVVIVVVFILDGVIFINAKIPSGSMENTVMTGDRIFGLRLAYGINLDFFDKDLVTVKMRAPERFDIVIFRYPENEKELYIKRIVGLPGEKVEVRKGEVYINDELIEQPFMEKVINGEDQSEKKTSPRSEMGDGIYQVPEDSYFVMGDNRINSSDSRFWHSTHYVTYNQIVGKALFRYWPLTNMKVLW